MTYSNYPFLEQYNIPTAFAVGQYRRNHLRHHYNLRETLHPPPIPQDLYAFQNRRPASLHRNPCQYMERANLLRGGHLLLDIYMLSP